MLELIPKLCFSGNLKKDLNSAQEQPKNYAISSLCFVLDLPKKCNESFIVHADLLLCLENPSGKIRTLKPHLIKFLQEEIKLKCSVEPDCISWPVSRQAMHKTYHP